MFLKDSFARYTILSWLLFSFSPLKISYQWGLAAIALKIFILFGFCPFSWKFLLLTEWVGSSVPGNCLPPGGEDYAQLFSLTLGAVCVSTLFLMNSRAHLPLGDLEQLCGTPLIHSEAPYLPIMSRRNSAFLERRCSGGCALACSQSWSPCGPCRGPQQPSGSTGPHASVEGGLLFF